MASRSTTIMTSNAEMNDDQLEKTRLMAVEARQLPLSLLATKEEFREEAGNIASIVENANPEDPRMLGVEVEAHKQYVSKLKFRYQEKASKLRMSRILCEDQPPDLSPEHMDELREEAATAKEDLKLQKEMLTDAFDRMRILIPEWQRQHTEMIAKAERTERLIREIQNAKVQLAQIRARHPEPRLTLDQASQFCDDQMENFIAQSEKKDELAAQAAIAKERADKEEVKTRALKEELMKREREVEKNKAKMQSSGGAVLPDRLATYAEFLKANTWVAGVNQETDNEVRLLLSPPGFQRPVTLSVVFDPVKYTLAGAQLIDSPVGVDEEPISVCVTRNDFVGLVNLVCQRLSLHTVLAQS